MKNNLYDKFYTHQYIAKHLIAKAIGFLHLNMLTTFIEPSAGNGSFSEVLAKEGYKVDAFDIMPENINIRQADFLKMESKNYDLMIGNPPFGKKGDLAIKFINKGLKHCQFVAFILPATFLKYSAQSKIDKEAVLAFSEALPENSFFTPDGKSYNCPSVFQIWTNYKTFINLREKKPNLSNSDFKIHRHNATEISKKYLDYDWDFCVYCQGRKDYNLKFFKEKDYNFVKERMNGSSDQFYFFKALNKEVLDKLLKIDFNNLAYENSITPGFSKWQIIKEYEKI
jgi:predicted RNA methylase